MCDRQFLVSPECMNISVWLPRVCLLLCRSALNENTRFAAAQICLVSPWTRGGANIHLDTITLLQVHFRSLQWFFPATDFWITHLRFLARYSFVVRQPETNSKDIMSIIERCVQFVCDSQYVENSVCPSRPTQSTKTIEHDQQFMIKLPAHLHTKLCITIFTPIKVSIFHKKLDCILKHVLTDV